MSKCNNSSVVMALTHNVRVPLKSENAPRSSLPAVGMQDNVGRAMAAKLDLDAAYTPCEVVNYAMNKARDDGVSNVGVRSGGDLSVQQ